MYAQYYIAVQILENMVPIDHEWNKDERSLVDMKIGDDFRMAPEELARVKYSIGMTINIGDYQSARVDVGIELPTHIDDTHTAYDNAVDFCNDKLMDEVANLQSLKKGGK